MVRSDTAREARLLPVQVPRRTFRGFDGQETTINSCYYLPLLDSDGDLQVVCAYRVDNIFNRGEVKTGRRHISCNQGNYSLDEHGWRIGGLAHRTRQHTVAATTHRGFVGAGR
jgi:hypothetical protein